MNLKKTAAFLTAGLLALSLAGCSGGFSGKSADPQAWAKTITKNVKFTDDLTALGTAAAEKRYAAGAGSVVACAVYAGTGATAEEFAVWKMKDEKSAETMLQNAKDLVKSQQETYADYRPAEVPKLKNAVLEQRDTVVVLCVSADDAGAKKVIDGLFAGR